MGEFCMGPSTSIKIIQLIIIPPNFVVLIVLTFTTKVKKKKKSACNQHDNVSCYAEQKGLMHI